MKLTRAPGFHAAAFLLVLVLTMLAVAACGGRSDSGGDGGVSARPSSGNGAGARATDSAMGTTSTPGTCTDPTHVSIGGTIRGSTCGGTYLPINDTVCSHRGPVAFFYVDAPSGAAFSIDSTTEIIWTGYTDCADTTECATGTSLTPLANVRLFSVQSPGGDWMSDSCGEFTITVASQ